MAQKRIEKGQPIKIERAHVYLAVSRARLLVKAYQQSLPSTECRIKRTQRQNLWTGYESLKRLELLLIYWGDDD